ncbi:ATP-grasp domain-containing protein [Candidatus Poribacteria bacterium]
MLSSNRAIISYGWNRIAYAITQSLGKRGVEVIVGDNSRLSAAGFSKYAYGRFSYCSFYQDPESFVKEIINKIKETGTSVYIPCHEEILLVARYIELFPPEVVVPIAPFDTLLSAHDKGRLMGIAKDIGISIPKTLEIGSLDELKPVSEDISYPAVIKLKQSNSAKGVFYAQDQQELIDIYSKTVQKFRLEQRYYPLIQEYVAGEGWGVSMLYNRGDIRAKFTHRRLREKTYTGGTSTRRISTVNTILEDAAKRLLDHLEWHGVAMVEFKYDPESKKYWLIEVNPRFWGSLALAVAAGVDFPWLLYLMATEGDVEPVLSYQTGVKARWLLGDVLALISCLRHSNGKLQAVEGLFSKDDVFDDLCLTDPLPFFVELLYYFSKFVKTRNVNPIDKAMLTIDKDGTIV